MGLTYPPSRRSDLLNATNATRYDWVRAAPSDSLMRSTWITWAVLAGSVACICLTLIVGLLSSRRARRKSFNLYLVFLTAPDALFSGMCAITCSLSAGAGRYYSTSMCEFQSWYCVFGFTANMWMNLVVARHLHDMLETTKGGRRYDPPTRGRVCTEAAVVYGYAAVLASLTLLPERARMVPIREDAFGGVACLPAEYDLGSTLFFWLLFVPLMIGVPIAYIAWVCYDVHRRGLLPRSGRNRFLALYFLRLVVVFVGMWLPTVILIFGVAMRNYWVSFMGGSWSHLQGFVSAAVSLTKPDVKKAVRSFLCCRCREEHADVWHRHSMEVSTFNSSRSMSRRRSSAAFSAAGSSAENLGTSGYIPDSSWGTTPTNLEQGDKPCQQGEEKKSEVRFHDEETAVKSPGNMPDLTPE